MQAKVLCILLIAASASAALLPPLGGRAVIDANISISRNRQPLILPTFAKPTLPPKIKIEQQPKLQVPQAIQHELGRLTRLGQDSSQFVNNLLKDAQKWVDDAIRTRAPCPSTTPTSTTEPSTSSDPASSSEQSTTDATSSSTDASSSTTSAESPSSTDDDSSSESSEESTSPSPTTTVKTTTVKTTTVKTTTPSTTTTNRPATTKSRKTRDLTDVLSNINADNAFSRVLDFNPLGNVSSALAKVDFSKVNKAVPKIPPLDDVSQLPVLPGLRENVKYARDMTTRVLGGRSDLRSAIQNATQKAIRSPDPVGALTALCYTILHIYYDIAVNSPLFIVGTAVLQDGLLVIGSVIKSVVLIVSSDIAKLVG